MRKNAVKVIEAFKNNQRCNEKTISTDGTSVWSYQMKIAERTPYGINILSYDRAPSATTKSHVRALQQTFPNHGLLVNK